MSSSVSMRANRSDSRSSGSPINVVFGVFIAVLPHQIGGLFGFLEGLVNLGFAVFWLFLMYKAYLGERYRIPELANVIDQVAGTKP